MAVEDKFGTLDSSLEAPAVSGVEDMRAISLDSDEVQSARLISNNQALTSSVPRLMKIIIAVMGVLFVLAIAFVIYSKITGDNSQGNKNAIENQSVDLKDNVSNDSQKKGTLTVNGGINAQGSIKIAGDSGSSVVLAPSAGATTTTLTLPNQSGLLCLSSNNCNFTTEQQLTDRIAGLQFPASSFINDLLGSVVLKGAANQINVDTNPNGTIQLSLDQALGKTSTPFFAGLGLSGGVTAGSGQFSSITSDNLSAGSLSASNLSTASIDTPGNTALNLGAGNASQINLQKNTNITGNLTSTGTVQATGYIIDGTAGIDLTCGGGDVLQNAIFQGGIITGASCVDVGGGSGFSIAGSGTANRIARFTDTATIGVGVMIDDGSSAGVQTNSNTAFYVQDTNGINALNVNTNNQTVTVAQLLPQTIGSVAAGTGYFIPAQYSLDTSIKTVVDSQDDAGSSGVDMDLGTDGFARIAQVSYDGSQRELKYVRCTDINCTSSIVAVIDSALSGDFALEIAIGTDGFARIAYHNPDERVLRLVVCQDIDCVTRTNLIVDATYNSGNDGIALRFGSDGLVRLAYYANSGSSSTRYLACNDAACTNPSITDIDSNAWWNANVVAEAAHEKRPI